MPRSKTQTHKADKAPAEETSTGRKSGTTAEQMAKRQREISVAEFFTKNRHLLGFDSPKKALLTAVKEAVDNSLDACEEAGILPEIWVTIEALGDGPALFEAEKKTRGAKKPGAAGGAENPKAPKTADEKGQPDPDDKKRADRVQRFRLTVRDNGPGIVKKQIPNIFGKLLYGSKFHRRRQARGQQGIGISAAGMYGQLTTGQAVRITSKPGKGKDAHYFEVRINTKTNTPEVPVDKTVQKWDLEHGTEVTIDLEGAYQKGGRSLDAYLEATAVANPHLSLHYRNPMGEKFDWKRAVETHPKEAREIKPHPHGVELGLLDQMLKATRAHSISGFLTTDFSRVGPDKAQEICKRAGVKGGGKPRSIARGDVDRLHAAIQATDLMAPPLNCLSPIGEKEMVEGLKRLVQKAEFYCAVSRRPAVYRGNPFLIECALAYGGSGRPQEEPAELVRFANRVPLMYQQSACATFKAAASTNWRAYGLQQPRGGLPVGPITLAVHIVSVWVPFTSEAKEAIASYPEILKETRLALQECGRQLGVMLKRRAKDADEKQKRDYIKIFIPHLAEGMQQILGFPNSDKEQLVKKLTATLEKSRKATLSNPEASAAA